MRGSSPRMTRLSQIRPPSSCDCTLRVTGAERGAQDCATAFPSAHWGEGTGEVGRPCVTPSQAIPL